MRTVKHWCFISATLCYSKGVDDRLLDATVAVLAEHGPAGLTLERVA